ncbi:MAG: hypothetical protein ACOY31_04470 [Bacillota bacterium]
MITVEKNILIVSEFFVGSQEPEVRSLKSLDIILVPYFHYLWCRIYAAWGSALKILILNEYGVRNPESRIQNPEVRAFLAFSSSDGAAF